VCIDVSTYIYSYTYVVSIQGYIYHWLSIQTKGDNVLSLAATANMYSFYNVYTIVDWLCPLSIFLLSYFVFKLRPGCSLLSKVYLV
jgi:hypothetical protein